MKAAYDPGNLFRLNRNILPNPSPALAEGPPAAQDSRRNDDG
ncbi:hypothetical protein ACIA6T_16960 [Streptomyces sp. NPDC051740]